MAIIRSRRTLAFVFVALLIIIYLVDSRNEIAVLENTSLPEGMQKPGPKKSYRVLVKQAAAIDPAYPIGIGLANLPDISKKLPKYLKYKEHLISPVVNQEICASCWAISVCQVISDRISLLTGGKIMRPLSYQELLTCFNPKGTDKGCEVGGSPEAGFHWAEKNGLSADSRYPYAQQKTTQIAPCDSRKQQGPRTFVARRSVKSLCEDPYRYKEGSVDYLKVIEKNMQRMKVELYLHGSICCIIFVYKSMYNFSGLHIYNGPEKGDEYVGGHAAVIFGYSEEVNGVEESFDGNMWFVRNSWSSAWPIKSPASKGLFYMRAGQNCCGIEPRASAAQPVITEEIRASMAPLEKRSYRSYSDYVSDPQRANYVKKSTRLHALLKK